jgi:phosphoribosyl-AMP cyclohydrolase
MSGRPRALDKRTRIAYTPPSRAQARNNTFDEETMLRPDFAKCGGLVPVIAQEGCTGEVLMLAYMNEEAWDKTLRTGEVHYFSRSRKCLWHKGGTSGHVQKLKSVRLDCDADTVLVIVEQVGGAACHTGRRSCFYRELAGESERECSPMVFDPKEVYGK